MSSRSIQWVALRISPDACPSARPIPGYLILGAVRYLTSEDRYSRRAFASGTLCGVARSY